MPDDDGNPTDFDLAVRAELAREEWAADEMAGRLPDSDSPVWDELQRLVERQAGQPIASITSSADNPLDLDITFEDGTIGHVSFVL